MDEPIYVPRRVPTSEIEKFVGYLSTLAENEGAETVFTDKYADSTLSLRYLLEVYQAGVDKRVPQVWLPLYARMKREESEEYKMYLALKRKYGDEPKLLDIANDHKTANLFVFNEPPKNTTRFKKRSKRNFHHAPRAMKKDGNVVKFE